MDKRMDLIVKCIGVFYSCKNVITLNSLNNVLRNPALYFLTAQLNIKFA